jgi:uncharacterized protein YebE (UPF0316 family)
MEVAFLNTQIFSFLVLPLLIFLARVIDVSMGTLRVIFISKGFRKYATLIGFFEVIIWLAAINQIMSNLTNIYLYLAYALGFATGTYVGMMIEEKISVGKVMIRIITKKHSKQLLQDLKKARHTVTSVGAEGQDGKVRLIMTVVNRHDAQRVIDTVKKRNPHAFYSIEDVRFAYEKTNIKEKRNYFRYNIFRK